MPIATNISANDEIGGDDSRPGRRHGDLSVNDGQGMPLSNLYDITDGVARSSRSSREVSPRLARFAQAAQSVPQPGRLYRPDAIFYASAFYLARRHARLIACADDKLA